MTFADLPSWLQVALGTLGLLSIWVAFQAWRSAESTAKQTASFGRQQARAYLGMVNPTLHHAPTEIEAGVFTQSIPFIAIFTMKNAGITPALNVRLESFLTLAEHPRVRSAGVPPLQKPPPGVVILPGDSAVYSVASSHLLTEEQVKGLVTGTLAIYFWGRCTYSDVFGKNAETTWRYYWNFPAIAGRDPEELLPEEAGYVMT